MFAEDEEQVDKLLGVADRVPACATSSIRTRAACANMPTRGCCRRPSWRGADARAPRASPALYDRLVDATKGEAVAILCTTSGTTAHPKLAMLSAARLLRHCAAYLAFEPKGPDDEYVSVLPLPWIMEQVYALGKALLCRMKVNFVEEPDTMMARLPRDRARPSCCSRRGSGKRSPPMCAPG